MKKCIALAFTAVVLLIVVICPAFASSLVLDNKNSDFARKVAFDSYVFGIETTGSFCVKAKRKHSAASIGSIGRIYVKTVSECGSGSGLPDKEGVTPYVVSGTWLPWRSFTITANNDGFSISEH